jgi:hypothetical protein
MDGEQRSNKASVANNNPKKEGYYHSHIFQYGLVGVVFIFSIALLFQLKDPLWKLIVITALSAFYLSFGVWHHIEENNLTNKHVLEYLIVSTIIFVVLYSLFL